MMTTDSLLAPLEGFLQQTQQLQILAREGDWIAFENLLAERQSAMTALGDNAFLIAVAQAGKAEEMRDLLQQIKIANEHLAQVAESSRAELEEQLRQALQAGKAIDAYKR